MPLNLKEEKKEDILVSTLDKVLKGNLSARVDVEVLPPERVECAKRLNMLIEMLQKSKKEKEMYTNMFRDSYASYENYIYCLSAFNRIGTILDNTLYIDDICKSVIKICKEELGFRDYIIALKLKGEPGLKFYNENGLSELNGDKESLQREKIINRVLQEQKSLLLKNDRDIALFRKILIDDDISRVLFEPVFSNKKIIGAIGFASSNGKVMNPGDERLLVILANLVGHVITIANLYKETGIKSKEIKNSKNKLQALFDGITDMILVVNKDFDITMANYKLAEFCNTIPQAIIGKKCYSSCYKQKDICLECPSLKTFESKKPQFAEFAYGDEILHLWTYPMFNLEGELEFVIEYAKFVTEQKKLEREIQQAEKLSSIGQLAANIVHEIRNPLSGILTTVQLLEEDFTEDDTRKEDMGDIIKEIGRIEKLMNELLSFSKPKPLEFTSADINNILETTLSFVKKKAKVSDVEIVSDFDKTLPEIKADPTRLQQVFLNLSMNAIESMPNGGRLGISTKREDRQWVEVRFEDSGTGIPREDIGKIFDPFFSKKKEEKGTGLGLSVSYRIIKDHKGEIDVESEEGKGTTFILRLKI